MTPALHAAGCGTLESEMVNVMPPVLPSMLEIFIAEVLPILRKRGLFRTEYEGGTLRAHFALPRPEIQF